MRSASLPWCGAVLLVLAAPAGCTKKPLQDLDGGGIRPIGPTGDGGIRIDIDGAVDVSGTNDAIATDASGAWDAPGGGLLSFNVTSQLKTEAGVGPSHAFTMTLDLRRQIAVIGTPGSNTVVPFEQTAGGALRLRPAGGNLVFAVPVTGVCAASAYYSDLTFVIGTSNGLLGTGEGSLATYDPALGRSVAATMVLSGVVDKEPPTLSLSAGGEITEPWTPLWLVSSDPLSTQQVRLISLGGDVVTLGAPTGMEMYASLFAKPSRMLHFGDEYEVILAGITDLAGNQAGPAGTAFNTQGPPPLVAADGFESVTGDTLGYAQVLSGAGAPTISGARSLYIAPAESLGAAGRVTQFAVRVPLSSGATVVRFSYRSVNPGDDFGTYFIIGSEGGTIGTASVSTVPGATTPATIGQTQVALGPLATATIGLPADAHGEVVLARSAAQPSYCGGPAPQPVPGLIIDDLRAE